MSETFDQRRMSENTSQNYLETYNRIMMDGKMDRSGLQKTRNSINFESNANDAAKTIQQYLERSRRKAEKYLPQKSGESTSPSPINSKILGTYSLIS